jgi:hypothetical protein
MEKAVLIAFLATASAVALPIAAVSAVAAPEAKAASCVRGTKPAIVGGNFKCLRAGQQCSASYQAAYRKYGFHCAKGRLRKGTGIQPPGLTFTPPPPYTPPPPAPGAAVDGHYKGVTSQNETIEFDITNGGSSFHGLKTGQINEGCTPGFSIHGNNLQWNYIPQPGRFDWGFDVSSAGDFTLDTDLPGWSVAGSPATEHLTVRGHMSGQAGSGSLELKTAFVANGVAYSCGSGFQTWTVIRVG